MLPAYQQPMPNDWTRQQQQSQQQKAEPQRQTFTKADYDASRQFTTYSAPKQQQQASAPASMPQALPMPAYQQAPSQTFRTQGMSYGQGQPPVPGNAGNVANNQYGKPPSFTSTMTDAYGQPTTPQQFYPQQDAFVSQLINRMGQIQGGTWLGQGPPPADFGRRPDMDFGQMWNDAGQMVNDGWRNPFSPGMASPVNAPDFGTPYQPGFGGGFPDAPPLMPIDTMRPTYDGATGNLKRPSRPLPEPTYQGLPPRGPGPAPIGDGPIRLPANIPLPAQDFSRLPRPGMPQPIQPQGQGNPYGTYDEYRRAMGVAPYDDALRYGPAQSPYQPREVPRAQPMPQADMPPLLSEDEFWKARHQLHFQSRWDKDYDPHGVYEYGSHADYVDGTKKKRDMWRNAQMWPAAEWSAAYGMRG